MNTSQWIPWGFGESKNFYFYEIRRIIAMETADKFHSFPAAYQFLEDPIQNKLKPFSDIKIGE